MAILKHGRAQIWPALVVLATGCWQNADQVGAEYGQAFTAAQAAKSQPAADADSVADVTSIGETSTEVVVADGATQVDGDAVTVDVQPDVDAETSPYDAVDVDSALQDAPVDAGDADATGEDGADAAVAVCALPCEDGNPCTSDTCENGNCVYAPVDATCTDGDACTTTDTCKDKGCAGGAAPDCDDQNVCTDDACDKTAGCTHLANAATCTDGDACTTADACKDKGCVGGAKPNCDDQNVCTDEACDKTAGCTHLANVVPCSDGNACTTADTCKDKGCVGGTKPNCDDQNVCSDEACDKAAGCTHLANAATCTDGDACTAADACKDKGCVGGAKANCDDANACTLDNCEVATGCKHAPVAVGAGCGTTKSCDGAGACVTGWPAGMALVPAGTFWMGCNAAKDANCQSNEKPQHKVTLSAYYMDLIETTVAQYKACVDAGECTAPGKVQPDQYATYPGLADRPVNFVSWTQAQAYCKWRGVGFDLPTEAQWQMAARGNCEKNGSTAGDPNCAKAMRTYPWGEAAPTCTYAVMNEGVWACGKEVPWVGGSKPAGDSPYGLHDMGGNVWEMTRDWYASAYSPGDQTDPLGPVSGTAREFGGGAMDTQAGGYNDLRVANREYIPPSDTSPTVGLRCSRAFDLCAGVTCPDLPCATQACAPATGKCVAKAKPDGGACDDGNACTTLDKCSSGVCAGAVALNCDDGNACTADTCDGKLGCQHSALADSSACATGKYCSAGACTANAVGCSKDGDVCGGVKGTCSDGHCFWTDAKGYKWTLVPAGTFWMGCNTALDVDCAANETPQHQVDLSPYWIGVYEVTVANYKACLDGGGAGCTTPATGSLANWTGKEQHPVNRVTWAQSQAYCLWLGGDLPTEAQWEKAARGGCEAYPGKTCKTAGPKYVWGNTTPSCGKQAVFSETGSGCGTGSTYPVGAGSAQGQSVYGAHDMAGNLWEWTLDWFDANYFAKPAASQKDPTNSVAAAARVFRGGSLVDLVSSVRLGLRYNYPPTLPDGHLGIRCARTGDLCAGVTCPDLPCATQTCDPSIGKCVAKPKADGGACDDGNACSTGDACAAGVCKGLAPLCGSSTCDCGETPVNCPVDCGAEPTMVSLPAGTFAMGSPDGIGKSDEHPQHPVTLSAFQLDKTEVTVAQYKAFYDHLPPAQRCTGQNSSSFLCGQPATSSMSKPCNWGFAGKDQHPVNCTDWFQAGAYCAWAHAGGRLPTEAEFEYASRSGGKAQTYPWGDQAPSCTYAVMNSATGYGCGTGGTMPVCSKPAGNSSQGACDLACNVVEWCSDWYGPYPAVAQTNPMGALSGSSRVVRQGSYYNDAVTSPPRAAIRDKWGPSVRYTDFGFRCARTDLCAGVTCPDLPCSTQACDPGTGKCVTQGKANGGVCTEPNQLADLAIWLDANDASTVLSSASPATKAVNGQSIVKWLDKSGKGVDVALMSGYPGPVLTANVLNGKPIARFTGTAKKAGQMLVGSQSIGASAVTLVAVYAYRALPVPASSNFGQVVDFGMEPGDGMGITCNDKGQAFTAFASATFFEPTPPILGQFRVESLVYDQTKVQSWLNGASMGAAQAKSGANLGSHLVLGAHRYDYGTTMVGWEYFANSDLAEVIVYKRALTPTERLAVEGYLKVKYKLP